MGETGHAGASSRGMKMSSGFGRKELTGHQYTKKAVFRPVARFSLAPLPYPYPIHKKTHQRPLIGAMLKFFRFFVLVGMAGVPAGT